jgi:DNA-binding transcriptional LysR family regulator
MSDTLPELPEPRLLQLFDVLYGTRSVTRAAEQLGLSQPTVSIWLARLREQLRDPLFVRTPAGMMPTPQADALIVQAREALETLRRLAAWEAAFVPATAERRFRICMTDASHITLLPRLLAHVRTHAPRLRLEAARMDIHTAQALEHGEADLAVGYAPWLESGIYQQALYLQGLRGVDVHARGLQAQSRCVGAHMGQQALYLQDWVCLVNAGHPRLAAGLDLVAYAEAGHITVAAGTGAQLLDGALERTGIRRKVYLELPSFLGLAAIVSTTDLVVTLPRHIGQTLARLGGVTVHACPVDVPGFAVCQHWHARYHQDPANLWLRRTLAGLFMGGAQAGA